MAEGGARFDVDTALATAVCARLGLGLPTVRAEVDQLYHRWLDEIWFDPVAKLAAMADGRRPPGADADAWCRQWLSSGLGGTCWGQSVAFAAIVGSAGANAWIGLERMVDASVVDFHSHVIVDDAGSQWLYDPIHASSGGLLLANRSASRRGPIDVELALVDGRFEHHVRSGAKSFRYHLLSTHLDRSDVEAFCAVSATHSGLGARRLWARRLPGDTMVKARPSVDGLALEVETDPGGGSESEVVTFSDIAEGFSSLGCNYAALALMEQAHLLLRGDDGWRLAV